MSDILEAIAAIIIFIWSAVNHAKICRLESDISDLNRCIKRLQRRFGVVADGIDKVYKGW